jgi:hypothetical protein
LATINMKQHKGARVEYMKSCLWILVAASVAVTVTACREKSITEEPPLLLEAGDGLGDLPPAKGPVANNSRCHVCHVNYAGERLAVLHARANVGCQRCHGASDAHCTDEDNVTPPEIMFAGAKINASCMSCHPEGKINIPKHKPLFADTTGKTRCTDCHGEHRLRHRTRRWDKATGKLLADDGVRMLTDTPNREKRPSP